MKLSPQANFNNELGKFLVLTEYSDGNDILKINGLEINTPVNCVCEGNLLIVRSKTEKYNIKVYDLKKFIRIEYIASKSNLGCLNITNKDFIKW